MQKAIVLHTGTGRQHGWSGGYHVGLVQPWVRFPEVSAIVQTFLTGVPIPIGAIGCLQKSESVLI